MKLIGADIGGTHISVAELRSESGGLGVDFPLQRDVDTSQDADSIISSWAELIAEVSQGEKDFYLGISMPGPFDYERGISLIQTQGKMRALYGLSVKELLASSLGVPAEKIRFTNDAEAFLIGENLAGAGMGMENLIGITLGTGLGSAIKIQDVTKDAKLWTAPFRDGIAEDYLGTAWFVQKANTDYGLQIKGVKDLLQPDRDPRVAQAIFREFGATLGEFLLPYVVRLQIQKVILGGKISLVGDRFVPFTQGYLEKFGIKVPIQVSALGEKAALIGAVSPFLT
ncbi:ROK family protein [Algoriphagus sp. AK58]|uniref:ROK family protein n=1 Tax=Algoriphagus sp. AK58 TaxID=1406877 RepID=UPI001650017B|nr:ROK family protein [Algoriphagus sp. AK58]MBC6365821.1 ROK family protein [Algoriphagus sp. AK58]